MKITFILFFAFIAAAMAGQEHFCEKLGNPENECGKFGMKVISKDDFDCRTTTRDSDLCMVKAGNCYTLYPDAKKGTNVATFDGKQISHVTYCAHGAAAEVPEPAATSAAPEPEATSAAPEPEATSAAPEPEATSAHPEPEATPEPEVTYTGGLEHFCGIIGKPENECGKYGMNVISKDDFDCRVTTKDSDLCMVKAGTCYTLYKNAKKGTKVAAFDGKQISHVTYCASGGGGGSGGSGGGGSEPEPSTEPAVVPEPKATSAAPEPKATSAAPEPKATSAAPEPEATSAHPEPEATSAAPEPKSTKSPKEPKAPKKPKAPKWETPAPAPEAPVSKPAIKPCNNDIATDDLPNVIYIAAEAEDCTSALQKEVNDLEVMVEKITMLLKVKGVPVGTGETCALPPGRGGTGSNPPPGGNGGNGGNPPPGGRGGTGSNPPPGGNGGNPNPPPGGRGGNPPPGGGNGGNPPPMGGGNGGNPNPPPGGGGMTGGNPPPMGGGGGNGGNPPGMGGGNGSPPERVSSTGSSSAAVNTMLVVGLVVGAAVAAGVAAVAIGIAVSSSAAGAGAASSAAPMSAAATNPLYTPLTSGGSNAGFA